MFTQNQNEPTEDVDPSAYLILHSSRFSRWLEWCCAERWRALVTWIALTALMSGVIKHVEWSWIRAFIRFLSGKVPMMPGLPLATVELAWRLSVEVALLNWFQPLLLRLNFFRGVLWLALFAAMCAARMLSGSFSSPPLAIFIFLAAALPGVALIGCRSRPWMILPAAALFAAVLVLSFHTLVRNLVLVAANVPYAAILLYGTRAKAQVGLEKSP